MSAWFALMAPASCRRRFVPGWSPRWPVMAAPVHSSILIPATRTWPGGRREELYLHGAVAARTASRPSAARPTTRTADLGLRRADGFADRTFDRNYGALRRFISKYRGFLHEQSFHTAVVRRCVPTGCLAAAVTTNRHDVQLLDPSAPSHFTVQPERYRNSTEISLTDVEKTLETGRVAPSRFV
jgi:hypothetical protein